MLAPPRAPLAGLIALAGLVVAPRPARADDPPHAPPAAVTCAGRVVERATRRPIAGAAVVLTRTAPGSGDSAPPWVGATTLRTDAEGRFALAFPPEQVADARAVVVAFRVDHPDFVPVGRDPVALSTLLDERGDGGESPVAEVDTDRGEVFTARVVNPDGSPADEVPFEFDNWTQVANTANEVRDATAGRTDALGRIRLRMPATRGLVLRLLPDRSAPTGRFWGHQGRIEPGAADVPLDLGEIRLEPGLVVAGRLLDGADRPLAGRGLVVRGRSNRFERTATTDAAGRFAFAPLRPGNYLILGAGQDCLANEYHDHDLVQPPLPAAAAILRPRAIFLEAGVEPAPLELREAPTVRVAVRFVDSAGRPAPGTLLKLAGELPALAEEHVPGGVDEPNDIPPEALDDPEPRYTTGPLAWSARLVPDAAGRAEFRAPRGLWEASLSLAPPDEGLAVRTRRHAGGPLAPVAGGPLGTLDADRAGIEVVVHRAPTVLIRVATEDGAPVPGQASVFVGFSIAGTTQTVPAIRQPDGRFRTRGMLPDQEYALGAWAPNFIPGDGLHLALAEGATAEVELGLRRQPEPLVVGDLAPPFAFATTDGRVVELADYRGRHLLLHLWNPFNNGDADLARVEAIRCRVGADRLAVLGLALTADAAAARRVIAARQLAWPQAILRDEGADPMVLNYGHVEPPGTFLIGPDGTILALAVTDDDLDRAVAQVLGAGKP